MDEIEAFIYNNILYLFLFNGLNAPRRCPPRPRRRPPATEVTCDRGDARAEGDARGRGEPRRGDVRQAEVTRPEAVVTRDEAVASELGGRRHPGPGRCGNVLDACLTRRAPPFVAAGVAAAVRDARALDSSATARTVPRRRRRHRHHRIQFARRGALIRLRQRDLPVLAPVAHVARVTRARPP